jgi:methionyl-tRNA formyltransferase
VAVFGCKHTTRFLVESLRADGLRIARLVTIDPAKAAASQVADYCDLREPAAAWDIPLYQARSYSLASAEDQRAIAGFGLDLAFVIGWQRLLPPAVLQALRIGAFGMHGSSQDLPSGRGRSPMNWSLIEGRAQFCTNLFRYDAGVDDGAILDRLVFSIQPTDTAETMHFKNTLAMKRLIERNLAALLAGRAPLRPQPDRPATYYPKRSPEDSLIDWRLELAQIERFIRAVAPPFGGAFSFCHGGRVVIRRAAIFETELVDFGYRDQPPGTVVEVFPSGKPLIRCSGGLLLVHEHDAPTPLGRGDRLVSPPDQIRRFPRNLAGFHDVEG